MNKKLNEKMTEIVVCVECGHRYDRRLHLDFCPECGCPLWVEVYDEET